MTVNYPPKLSGREQDQILALRQYLVQLSQIINVQQQRIEELEIALSGGVNNGT